MECKKIGVEQNLMCQGISFISSQIARIYKENKPKIIYVYISFAKLGYLSHTCILVRGGYWGVV